MVTTRSPATVATARPIPRNSGPYGAGVSTHIPEISSRKGPGSDTGPNRYGSRPACAIWACAAYAYRSRLNSGTQKTSGAPQSAAIFSSRPVSVPSSPRRSARPR